MTTFNIAANTVPRELKGLYNECAQEGGDKASIDTEAEFKSFCNIAMFKVKDMHSTDWEAMGLELKRKEVPEKQPSEIESDGMFVAKATGCIGGAAATIGACFAGVGGAVVFGAIGLGLGLVSSLLSLPQKHMLDQDCELSYMLPANEPYIGGSNYELIKKTDEEAKTEVRQ